jgi:hypothetical protein
MTTDKYDAYENQKEALHLIHKVLEENDFLDKLVLGLGTFLGAVRGQLNTKHNNWDDLDFTVNQKHFNEFKDVIIPKLLEVGFKIDAAWHTSFGKIGQLTLYLNHPHLSDRMDIHQIFDLDEYSAYCVWYNGTQLVKKINSKYYNNIESILLEGLQFYGPADKEEYLVDEYGEGWRVPCTSADEYRYWEDHPGIPWWKRIQYGNRNLDLNEAAGEIKWES